MRVSFAAKDVRRFGSLRKKQYQLEEEKFVKPFNDAYNGILRMPKEHQLKAFGELLQDVDSDDFHKYQILDFERSELRTLINRLTKSVS